MDAHPLKTVAVKAIVINFIIYIEILLLKDIHCILANTLFI